MSSKIAARFAVPLVVALAGSASYASADSGTVVGMRGILRTCDFNPLTNQTSQDNGTATATIRTGGGSVTADVYFVDTGSPGAHYDVSLIQLPRPANAPCDGPGPGVAVGALNADGVGVANTTLHDSLRSGTTSVWVFIRKPNPYSQSPTEFYTSDFPAKV